MLFSATMPNEILKLAGEILEDPRRVEVSAPKLAVERIEQKLMYIETSKKRAYLSEMLDAPQFHRVIVFVRTKRGANRIARNLCADGVSAVALHGNKSQNARQRALEEFNSGSSRVLVATDIASRGIDVPLVTHVINYELPDVPESYVHRIGRTARAGAEGVAISFCDSTDRTNLRDIEKLIRQSIPLMSNSDNVDDFKQVSDDLKAGKSRRPKSRRRKRRQTKRLAA